MNNVTNAANSENKIDNRKPAKMEFTLDIAEMPKDNKARVGWTPHATIKFKKYTIGFISNGAVYLRMFVPESRFRQNGDEWENVKMRAPRMNFHQACDYVINNFEHIFYDHDLMAKHEIERVGGFIKPVIVEYL